jgi:hypothetical protein
MTYLLVLIILVFAMVIVVQAYNTDKYIRDYRLLLKNGWEIVTYTTGEQRFIIKSRVSFASLHAAVKYQRDSDRFVSKGLSQWQALPPKSHKPYELGQWSTD